MRPTGTFLDAQNCGLTFWNLLKTPPRVHPMNSKLGCSHI